MKKALFNFITMLTYASIWLTDRVFGVPAAALLWLATTIRSKIATTGYFFMRKLDPVQCKEAEAENETHPGELNRQGLELKLMQSSYQVRDHAKETGDWTDHHTEAMEAIGNALLLELGWEEDAVNDHIKSVVESIEGLSFDGWFEED